MKLTAMTDFVLEQELELRNNSDYDNVEALVKIFNYTNFLKQPLELWMFVPCDEDGNIVENKFLPSSMSFSNDANFYREKYQQAKERCLFEGVNEIQASIILQSNYIIENTIHFDLQLTPTAIKQIGL